MKWKDFCANVEDCDLCPIRKAEICGAGMSTYDGYPVDPPCCSFDDDTDLDEWIRDYHERKRRFEEWQDKQIREQKAKREKALKAAETKRQMKFYCRTEIAKIKTLEKELRGIEAAYSLARSLAFAFNTTNEMFGYTERLVEKPETQRTIDDLESKIVEAKEMYQQKRKEFYANRRADNG